MTSSQDAITRCILPLVPFDGWSERALIEAAKNAGIAATELASLFPGGPPDCMEYFFAGEARAGRTLYHTVDTIWRLAGDESLDFNFYTKRATLAGVYSATLLFWLNDNSEKWVDTAEFLKRRLSEVAAFGNWKRELQRKWKRA